MAHWNHRVIEYVDPSSEKPWHQIHEVHYDDEGRPVAYTENPAAVCGDDNEEMALTLERMRAALNKPVLFQTDFCTSSKAGK